MKIIAIGRDYAGWETELYEGKTENVEIPHTDDIELAIETLGEAEYHALAMRALRTAFVNYSNRVVKEGNYAQLYNFVAKSYADEIASRIADFAEVKRFVLSKKDEYNTLMNLATTLENK